MSRYVSIAYKKLKASVYFDKTLLPLQGKIVKFEDKNIGKKLKKLTEKLDGGDKAWDEYAQRILKEIDVLVYPKKLYNSKEDDEQKKYKSKIIINKNNELLKIKRPKYFIDLPVEGHIISVLWVLFIGRILDDRNNPDNMLMYEHSYGNRLKKTLINPKTNDITYSPYLFEPYFSQYESWRDKALEVAKKNLNDNKDVIMISLDFKNFFYSVDINKDEYEKILCNYIGNYERWHKRIHDFIYIVLQEYSNKLRKLNTDQDLDIADKTFLPIGFYPSYILANWVLTPFDKEVIKRCNPVYYGRYVDDIIMVDKVEKIVHCEK